jgi:uncharacterized Rmd1/YagE family protein
MKKILLLLIFPLLMQSCLFEEKDYFEESASERIEGKITDTKNLLSSQSKGWILYYFPDLSYGGHNYAISFEDEQAKIACESEVVRTHIITGDPSYNDSCLYDVLPEQGTVLTFNTYSKLMHQFRNPSAYSYNGLEGDYEFILTSVEPDNIELTGKTTGHTMRMFPVPNSYASKESYLEAVQAMANNGKFGSYVLSYEGKFVDSVTGNIRGRHLSYSYDEVKIKEVSKKDDTVITVAHIPLIFTPEGFIVYHDKTENANRNVTSVIRTENLLPLFNPDTEYTEFTFDAANSKFVSKDGKIEFVKIPVENLDPNLRITNLMENSLFEYYSEIGDACSQFKTLWNTAATYLDMLYGSLGVALSDMSTGYDMLMGRDKYAFTFWCGRYNATYGIDVKPAEGTTNQISISPAEGGNLNWGAFGTYLNPLVNFFVNNSPWIIEPDDNELPQTVKLVSAANPDMWIYIVLYN